MNLEKKQKSQAISSENLAESKFVWMKNFAQTTIKIKDLNIKINILMIE